MHPVVKQKLEDNDFAREQLPEVANANNEDVFFEKVKDSKKPVIHKLIKIVRTRIRGKEHVYYHETLKSYDFLNNPINHTRVMGKYEDPQFITHIDEKTRRPKVSEIAGFETVHEWPWTPNIIDQWLSQEGFELDDICGFMVKDGGRTYGGFGQEQFCIETYDNLVTLGKYGTLSPAGIQKVIKKRMKIDSASST